MFRSIFGRFARWIVAHGMEEAQKELEKNPRVVSDVTEMVAAQVVGALTKRLPK